MAQRARDRWRCAGGLYFLGLFAALACSEPTSSAAEDFCDTLCKKEYRCGVSCDPNCRSARSSLDQFNRTLPRRFSACINGLSCNLLLSQDGWDDCWEEAVDATKVDSRTMGFCEEFAPRVFQCGWLYSQRDCEDEFRIWGAGVQSAVNACQVEADCNDFDQCVAAVFEGL